MSRNFRILFAIAVLALSVLACGKTTTPTAVSNVPIDQPTQAAAPIQAAAPTEAPQPTAVVEESTSADPDLANAVLTTADLPAGFKELSPSELQSLGLDEASLANSFQDTLKNAKPQSFKAFMNTDDFELVLTFVLAPLTLVEKASFDIYLADPDGAVKDFGEGAGSTNATVIDGMDKIGDSSVGITFLSGEGASALRGDVAISRQGSAVAVSMVFYLEGSTPLIGIKEVAGLIDQRVEAALK